MPFTSGVVGGYLLGDRLYPVVSFHSFDVNEIASPISARNLVSGSFAFLHEVGLGIAHPLEFRNILFDFDAGAISGTYQSETECVVFRANTNRFWISNFRFWMPSGSAIESGHLEYHVSNDWKPNFEMPSGSYGPVPSSLPTTNNVLRQDSFGYATSFEDTHVSQFIYLKLTLPSGYSLGRYGIGGSGTLAFTMTYDWWQII